MKRARFLMALLVAGCSTQHSALNPSPDSPAVIYAIPQSQAFAIAHGAILSSAGIAASGQQIDGFRFEITYRYFRGLRAVYPRLPGGGCEKTLIGALHAALEATGTATSVTSLETRPYGEGRDRSSDEVGPWH